MSMRIRFLMIAAFALLAACGRSRPPAKPEEVPPIPEQAIEQFTVSETENGAPRWVLTAVSAQIDDAAQRAVLQVPRVKFYERGAYVSTLIAARGIVNTQTYDILGEGACTLDTAKGEHLETTNLRYRSEAKRISTDDKVTLVRADEIIHGTGMEATPDLETIIIKKQRVEMRRAGVEGGT